MLQWRAWLGTRANFLGVGASDGNGNAPSRGVQSLQDGRVRRDSHHAQCSPGACAPSAARTAPSPKPPHWRAGSLLANFIEPLPSSESQRQSLTEIQARRKSRGISATLHQRWSGRPPSECVFGAPPLGLQHSLTSERLQPRALGLV